VFEYRNNPREARKLIRSDTLEQENMVKVLFFITLKAIRSNDVLPSNPKLKMSPKQNRGTTGTSGATGASGNDNDSEDRRIRSSSRIRNNSNKNQKN
jgi:hypothetical protein